MKVLKINYSKVFSLGNYENEKIGIEIEINEGEDATIAMAAAKKFVEKESRNFARKKEMAEQTAKSMSEQAERAIGNLEEIDSFEDLPF